MADVSGNESIQGNDATMFTGIVTKIHVHIQCLHLQILHNLCGRNYFGFKEQEHAWGLDAVINS